VVVVEAHKISVTCDANGRRDPGTKNVFGRDPKAAFPAIKRTQPRDGKDRYGEYVGIGLKGA
jgi:hypothetical protein